MLILGRREGDSILIDGGIKIVVVSCDRHGVRIGIEAPSHVKILRGEIAQQVAQENQAAAAPADASWLSALGAPTVAPLVPPTAPPAPPSAAEPAGD
ncbi:MAG: carbon storage regulator [Gemmatimonadaceae bacterium]|nr:carbon storage regulator [Gemmatimonadaceae bacterium]